MKSLIRNIIPKAYIALMTPDTMFKVYAKRGYKIISWEEVEIRSYIENTIFWCYAAFVGSDTSIFPTTESYSEYLSDLNAEITFPSIGDYVCSVARL